MGEDGEKILNHIRQEERKLDDITFFSIDEVILEIKVIKNLGIAAVIDTQDELEEEIDEFIEFPFLNDSLVRFDIQFLIDKR